MTVAHVFLAPYTLPVPFWLYLYGCAATLLLSFALLAYLARSIVPARDEPRHEVLTGEPAWQLWRWTLSGLRLGAVAALALTVAAGFAGPANPALNVGMTLFWVCFLLAFAYLTVLVGNLYEWINPWNTLAAALQYAGLDVDRARLAYPRVASYWPAVAFYMALVWIELFALPRPRTIAVALLIYTGVTLGGIVTFGRAAWLRHAEVFAVFFRAIATLAPVEYVAGPGGTPRIVLRRPLTGALAEQADHPSLVVFILFMLSSTTYDAIHETYLWISLYWQRLIPALQPFWGTDVIAAQAKLTTGYWWYQWLGLVTSPAFYLALYVLVLWMAVVVAREHMPVARLAGRFAFSLVPIAIAYHATHYAPLMLQQLPALVPQLMDPFGRGWWVPPVANLQAAPLPMSVVWHVQVAVLLAGHVAGVYLAHVVALRLFPTPRQGLASQVPMLALMVGYTCLGLWVLSLPLGLPQIVPAGGGFDVADRNSLELT